MYITCKVTPFTRSSIFCCYSCALQARDVVSIALTSLSYPHFKSFHLALSMQDTFGVELIVLLLEGCI